MHQTEGYEQAIDVLSQLRVGNVIGDSLRSQAKEVIEHQFNTLVDENDLEMFNALLREQRVSNRLRDNWADTVLDLWDVNEHA